MSEEVICKNIGWGTSQVVQWLRLHTPHAGAGGSQYRSQHGLIPRQGTRSLTMEHKLF